MSSKEIMLISSIFFSYGLNFITGLDVDPLGYILYCPCMGRFGNQADHFLGALGFAHGLNRTLVLPPWVEYRFGEPKSIQVPFNRYFKVEALQKYHKVVTMETFMDEIAPIEWPANKRISFCYMERGSGNTCNAKDGNPFGPFWDTFSVDFVNSEFYSPLHYDTYHHDMAKQWNTRYPPLEWPVIAFTGAPASFPVQLENRGLQKYLEWNDAVSLKADDFIKNILPKGAFIGIHLRNGVDWVRACEHIKDSPNLFAAPQCVGYRNEKGRASRDMCLPPKETIVRQLKRVVKLINNSATFPNENLIRSIFVSSDSNHMIEDLSNALKRMKIKVFKYHEPNPHVDLAILGKSNHFVGNCISSFSAFVKRDRDVHGYATTFWAFPTEKGSTSKKNVRDEL